MRRSVSDSEEDEERQRILSRTQKEIDASRQREDNLIAHLRDYRGRMEELHRKVNIEMYPHIACLLYKNRSRILFVPKLLIQIILFNKHLRGKIVQISILYDFSQKFFFYLDNCLVNAKNPFITIDDSFISFWELFFAHPRFEGICICICIHTT